MKKRREKHQKFPKKNSLLKKMNEKEKKEPKGKRKSQRAKIMIEKNHTKTHPVLNLRYQHKKAP